MVQQIETLEKWKLGKLRNPKKKKRRTSARLLPNWRRPGWPLEEADLSLSSWILRRSASLCFSSFRILTASWAVPTYPSPIPDIFSPLFELFAFPTLKKLCVLLCVWKLRTNKNRHGVYYIYRGWCGLIKYSPVQRYYFGSSFYFSFFFSFFFF